MCAAVNMNSRICVAVRKRPISDPQQDIVETPSPKVIVNEPKVKYDLTPYTDRHTFYFDEVFGENVNNAFIYQKCCLPLIDTVFSYGNATCFAYGQTGSGKTHTMLGNNKEPGLYAIAAKEIFARANKLEGEVYVSFYEIYGRKIFDLLNNRERLHAREDGEKVINICGLSEHAVTDIQEIFDVITAGSAYRAAGVTSANNESSRSHAVLQIEVREAQRTASYQKRSTTTIGKISFIDLAGNERGADTFDCDRKTRMEGAEINKSLLALKECIRSLGMGKSHVPFRGSILTEVLRDSFMGNSRTTMIATISPTSSHCVNTLNTLRYTQRVKDLGGESGGRSASGGSPSAKVEQIIPRQANRGGNRRKPFEAPPPVKRPSWVSDFATVPAENQDEESSRATARRGSDNSPRKNLYNRDSQNPDEEVRVKDPKIASIVRSHLEALRVSGSDDDITPVDEDAEILESSRDDMPHVVAAPNEEVRQVRKVHAYVVQEISKAEEKLVALHRQHIDAKMTGIKEEIRAIQTFEDTEQVDEYVSRIRVQLGKQMNDIKEILAMLSSINKMLKDEEDLSNTLTHSVKG